MFTKKDFCKMKIEMFARGHGLELSEVNESHIYESSTLAVCLEYLGLIHDEENMNYAATRGGIVFSHWDSDSKEVKVFTVRDLLELLPD